jgi:dTDP-4-dehydrorhamnose 3,5-epimerase
MAKNLELNYTTIGTDALLINSAVHGDDRGYFAESWNSNWKLVLPVDFQVAQTNVSWCKEKYTIRGFHAQFGSKCMAKLIRVLRGEIVDIFVDARSTSPDFGKVHYVHLTDNSQAVYVPRGFYHGYVAMTDDTLMTYHQDNNFHDESECGLNFGDKIFDTVWSDLNIDLDNVIVSNKDQNQPFWADANKFNYIGDISA